MMVKTVLLLLLVSLMAGCATGGFLGLAKLSYVDESIAATQSQAQESNDRTAREVDALRKDFERISELTTQLESLITQVSATRQATEELQQLATLVEARLQSLPDETLRTLLEIIQAHLEEQTD